MVHLNYCSELVGLKSNPLWPIAGRPYCRSHSSSILFPNQSAHWTTALLRWLNSHFFSVGIHENGSISPSGTKIESHPKPLPSTGSTIVPVHLPVKTTGSACGYEQNANVHTAVALLSSYPINILYKPCRTWHHPRREKKHYTWPIPHAIFLLQNPTYPETI